MSDQLFSEWCQQISQADKFIDKPLPPDPEVISATQAINWEPNHKQKDMRPRIYDGISKSHLLLDSGAAVTVVPAGPDDVPDPALALMAANGTVIECCGYKKVKVQIGRKQYELQAAIAKIKDTIIGWDFFRNYRLSFWWSKFGDCYLHDKKANIKKLLEYVAIPHQSRPHLRAVQALPIHENNNDVAFNTASMERLILADTDTADSPNSADTKSADPPEIKSEYKQILDR